MTLSRRGRIWDLFCKGHNTAEIARRVKEPEWDVDTVVHDFLNQLWKARQPICPES